MSFLTFSSNSATEMSNRLSMIAAYCCCPMNLPLGNRTWPAGPVCKILPHIVIGDMNAELLRLGQHHLLLNQLLAYLLLEQVHDHGIVGILRIALAHLRLRQLRHFLLADHFAGGEEAAVPVGIDHRKGVSG